MPRYIDADEFIKYEIKKNGCVPRIDGGGYNLDRLDDEVNNFHTADVQEVRHGHWEKLKNGYWCSNCCLVEKDLKQEYNYCPNCGAKMDGKEDKQ